MFMTTNNNNNKSPWLTNKLKRHCHRSRNKDRPKEKQLVLEIKRGFERRHGVTTTNALITNTTIDICFKILTFLQMHTLYEIWSISSYSNRLALYSNHGTYLVFKVKTSIFRIENMWSIKKYIKYILHATKRLIIW
jgi:hypothetical protein